MLVLPVALALQECEPYTTPAGIPCQITLTYQPSSTCISYSVKIYNMSGGYLDQKTLSPLSNGFCFFNFTNTTIGTYYFNITEGSTASVVVESDNMVILLLFIPLILSFFFIYWANNLEEEHEPLKWFMRLLSLVMIFIVYIGANLYINLYSAYSNLAALFDIKLFGWIFWTIMAVFFLYFIFKIFMSFKLQKRQDFERGILR